MVEALFRQDPAQAVAHVEALLASAPEQERTAVLYWLGRVQDRAGRPADALRSWMAINTGQAGALLPLLTIILLPIAWRIPITIVAVIIALAVTGGLGAKLGGAPIRPAIGRVVVGGAIALVVTWGIGSLLGVVVG